ncbi:MAG: thiamine pyrophosphate-dependent enzyme [Patescibacteria group bacterium]|nr:thiamine pyrophosphate-dependent enzyme [Patescibacteria group bacterium]
MEPRMPKCYKKESKPSSFCPGCGHSLTLKNLGFVMDEMKIADSTVFATDIGCSLLAWDFFDVDTVQAHHGRVTAMAAGLKRALPKSVVLAYMGDGGGYAIGLHHLIGAARRNDPITVILVNNTLYAMTGGQMAPTTFKGENTSSSPEGAFADEEPLLGPEFLRPVCHKEAFLARTSVDNPFELKKYLKEAIETQKKGNFSFVEVLSYCPVNWKTDARGTMDFMDHLKEIYKIGVIE